jgi:hypothetical protein
LAGGGGTNKIAYSTDGFSWQPSSTASSIISVLVYSVAWDGSQWIMGGIGTNQLAVSNDGEIWTPTTNGNTIFTDRVRGLGVRQ